MWCCYLLGNVWRLRSTGFFATFHRFLAAKKNPGEKSLLSLGPGLTCVLHFGAAWAPIHGSCWTVVCVGARNLCSPYFSRWKRLAVWSCSGKRGGGGGWKEWWGGGGDDADQSRVVKPSSFDTWLSRCRFRLRCSKSDASVYGELFARTSLCWHSIRVCAVHRPYFEYIVGFSPAWRRRRLFIR